MDRSLSPRYALLLGLLLTACSAGLGGNQTAQQQPAAANVNTKAQLLGDPRAVTCLATVENAQNIFVIPNGAAIFTRFPKLGKSPELERQTGEVLVVVFNGAYPGPVFTKMGTQRETNAPGEVDICTVGGGGEFNVYGHVPLEGYAP